MKFAMFFLSLLIFYRFFKWKVLMSYFVSSRFKIQCLWGAGHTLCVKYFDCFLNFAATWFIHQIASSQCAAKTAKSKVDWGEIWHYFLILTHMWGVWNTIQKNPVHGFLLHKPDFPCALYEVKLFLGGFYKKSEVTLL